MTKYFEGMTNIGRHGRNQGGVQASSAQRDVVIKLHVDKSGKLFGTQAISFRLPPRRAALDLAEK